MSNVIVTPTQIIAALDYYSEMDDTDSIVGELHKLARSIKDNGIYASTLSLSIDTITGFIYDAIDSLKNGNEVDNTLANLSARISVAFNGIETNVKVGNVMESQITLYNPSFDPGMDTSTCVEVDGKLIGLAFSVNGIQKLLSNAGVHVSEIVK